MSRLYSVESLFTLTGASADHRLRVPASLIGEIASAISAAVAGTSTSTPAGVDAKWIAECAADLAKHGKNALVVAGQRQSSSVHLMAYAMNLALGAIGNTVELLKATGSASADFKNFDSSATDTWVILGGNPVYNLNWTAKAKSVVRLGYYEDETSDKAV